MHAGLSGSYLCTPALSISMLLSPIPPAPHEASCLPLFSSRCSRWISEPQHIIYNSCKFEAMHSIRCTALIYKAGFMVFLLRPTDCFYCDERLSGWGPYIRITCCCRGTCTFWALSFFRKQRLLNHN